MSLDVCFFLVGIGNHVKKPLSAVVTSNVYDDQVEGGVRVIIVLTKKKVIEGDGDLKVIMLLAKKVMEGD